MLIISLIFYKANVTMRRKIRKVFVKNAMTTPMTPKKRKMSCPYFKKIFPPLK